MLGSIELKDLKLTYNGEEVESTKTFVTGHGEIYIGLYVKGCWVNIKSSEFGRIAKSEDEFYKPILK
jgi:hypothetical protein